MTKPTLYIIVAFLIMAMVPLVPKMIALRTTVLQGLHLRSFADWHNRNARTLTLIVRGIFVAIAVVLLIIGLTGG